MSAHIGYAADAETRARRHTHLLLLGFSPVISTEAFCLVFTLDRLNV